MLRMDTWEQPAPAVGTWITTSPTHYFRHAGQSVASLTRLVQERCIDYRCTERVIGWVREVRGTGADLVTLDAYEVLGWTSAPILRAALSHRIDALNPVAAFRLLAQPEIGQLELSRSNYILLRSRFGFGNEWPAELSGAISGFDVEPWVATDASELDGALAIEFEAYLNRFAGTEFAD